MVAMSLLLGGNILNIIGNWVLIYGKAGFPELGLLGAGVSTLVSRIVIFIIFFIYILKAPGLHEYALAFRKAAFSRRGARQIFDMGYPLALQTGMETSTFTISAVMVGWIGATALAAHQVTLTISQICFLMMMGLASSVSILVSNAYGRGDIKGVRQYASRGYFLILGSSVLFCTLIFLMRDSIIGMFTDSPEVKSIVLSLLFVLFSYQFGDGLQLCFCNALRGIQDVKPIMLMAFISYYIIAIPAAYLLGFKAGLGTTGIWTGFPIGLTIAGIFYFIRFRKKIRRYPKLQAESRGRTCSDYAEAQRDCKQSLNYIELPIKKQAHCLRQGPSGPHRSVSEVPCMGTEAVEVPAERSGAACPTGAVTAGDWGWTDRISGGNH